MAPLLLELPYPPSINHYWRRVGAKTLISREGRQFRENVVAIMLPMRLKPMDGPLEITIDVYPPDLRRRDIDNVLKSLCDSLQYGGAYVDDSQIQRIDIARREVVKGGKVIVKVEAADA